MEAEKLAYIAGILDGEGSIMIQKNASKAFMEQRAKLGCFHPHYHPALRIGMTERAPLDFIVQVTGIGKVYEEKPYHGRKIVYRWLIRQKEQIKTFLSLVLPYLIVKKKQSLLALKFIDEWCGSSGRPLAPDQIHMREEAWAEMRKLNGVVSVPATTKSRGIRGREKSAPCDAIV